MKLRQSFVAVSLIIRRWPHGCRSDVTTLQLCRFASSIAVENSVIEESKATKRRKSPSKIDINEVQHVAEKHATFDELDLDKDIIDRLNQLGYQRPFEIQAATLPFTLQGRDVLGKALTGSGKTLAFALPIIQSLNRSERTRNPRAIVMAPTRELCKQVHKCLADLAPRLSCVALYGGASYDTQNNALRRGADVICATPGRLNDHLNRGSFALKDIKLLILDEADEMLTPNFRRQIEGILQETSKDKQMLLFSATMPQYIKQIASRYMRDAVVVDISSDRSPFPDTVKHKAVKLMHWGYRALAVKNILAQEEADRTIIFVSTRVEANDFERKLNSVGVAVRPLHSDLSQAKREHIVELFRRGIIKALVATDVAARGLDIPETDLIIQVGQPSNGFDFYIHRTGRTGRAGRAGTAVLIHTGKRDDKEFIRKVKRYVDVEDLKPLEYETIVKHAIDGAVSRLDNIDFSLIEHATPKANELIESYGNEILAKALVVLADVQIERHHQYENDDRRGRSGENRSRRDRHSFSDDRSRRDRHSFSDDRRRRRHDDDRWHDYSFEEGDRSRRSKGRSDGKFNYGGKSSGHKSYRDDNVFFKDRNTRDN